MVVINLTSEDQSLPTCGKSSEMTKTKNKPSNQPKTQNQTQSDTVSKEAITQKPVEPEMTQQGSQDPLTIPPFKDPQSEKDNLVIEGDEKDIAPLRLSESAQDEAFLVKWEVICRNSEITKE